jgi:uncharacterized membrane protein
VARELKAGLLGLAIVSLLVVVAFAARGGHPTGDAEVTERSVPHAVENTFVTLILVVYAIMVVAVLIAAFRYRGSWQEPQSDWLRNFIVIFALMSLIGVAYWALSSRPPGNLPQVGSLARNQKIPELTERSRVPPRHAEFNWPLAVSVVVLVLVGGTVVYLRLRRPDPPQARATVEEDLAEAVETTIEDLRRERDARRAVIAAYANMERVLALHGFERRRAETPFEYLVRILRRLDVRESAVRSLTELFEYAKFSAHDIDSGMKEKAIDALEDVRDDLRREEVLAA